MYYDSSKKIMSYAAAGAVFFHAALFFLYLNFVLLRPETRNIVINNVDLLVQEKQAVMPKPSATKTLDFLKLALPSIPKIVPQEARPLPSIEIKTPEARRKNFDMQPKLSERSGRLQAQEKLEMDASRRAATAMNTELDIKADRSAAAMAPKIELEEVGLRKAPPMPENLKFDENARSFTPQTMSELNIAVDRAKKFAASPQGLAERSGDPAQLRQNARLVAAMPTRLTEARTASAEGATAGLRAKPVLSVAGLGAPKGQSGIKQNEESKKVEIEGPISKRKVLKYSVPEFPAWAKERGLLEASVSLKFFVDSSGRVQDNVSVDKTSGYGALDRLAADAIKKWQFEPYFGAESRQWGIITFRFITD